VTTSDGAIEHALRTLIARMKEITHLNAVLRKKNRRITAQRLELEERRRRIAGLLAAFDEVARSTTRAEALGIAAMVLRYDDRTYWNSFRREAPVTEEVLDDTQNEVNDESATEEISDPPTEEQKPPAPAPEGD
jgi:hypothetical protein